MNWWDGSHWAWADQGHLLAPRRYGHTGGAPLVWAAGEAIVCARSHSL